MIKIKRNSDLVPTLLISENGRGKKETQKAIAFFNDPKNHGSSFKFKVYANAAVKKALAKLCKGKCAYCESRFLHVYVGDVEHFRPKGRVIDRKQQRPGYYWLAADWDNLLLSCRNCNQSSKQRLALGLKKEISVGKVDKFPLKKNASTTKALDFNTYDMQKEEPYRLLINPCVEDPEEYFEYDFDGVIKPHPKIKDDLHKKRMALTSIEVFALQRVPLVQARERKVIDLLAQIQRVREAIERVDEAWNRSQTFKLVADNLLERELKNLLSFKNSEQEFLGLVRQFIRYFEQELNTSLEERLRDHAT